MNIETVGAMVAVGSPVVLVIYWVSKLEGRIDAQQREFDQLRKDIAYIRDRIDSAILQHHPR